MPAGRSPTPPGPRARSGAPAERHLVRIDLTSIARSPHPRRNVIAAEVHNRERHVHGPELQPGSRPRSCPNRPQIVKGPYLQNAGLGSIVVMWETDVESDGLVEFGTAAPGEVSAAGAGGVTIHEVTLTGLAPDTTYFYRVISANSLGSTTSPTSTFWTAPEEGSSFRFTSHGDTQLYPAVHADVVASILAGDPLPALSLHTG